MFWISKKSRINPAPEKKFSERELIFKDLPNWLDILINSLQ